jgi:hypothetical protein
MSSREQAVTSNRSAPVTALSPVGDDDAEILRNNGVKTVGDFLNQQEAVAGFLRDEEFDAAVAEAKTLTQDSGVAHQCRQEHSEWHDALVEGGHEPIAETVDAADITQPAGRPRDDRPIPHNCPELSEQHIESLRAAGYEYGSDLNGCSPEQLAEETSLDSETAFEVLDACRTEYHGLPVLEDSGHPLIPSKQTYREIWTRRTLSGAYDLDEVCYGAAQNEYPMCLVGYPGVGKSYLIAHICAMTNRPLISIDMDSSLRSEDLLGFHIPEDGGEVTFKYGIFPLAFKYGLWLNINELPAAEAGVWLAMHQMTEREPKIMLRSAGEKIMPHPAFRVTGTRNPNTEAFAGHGQSNEASDSRWEEIWVDYLPKRDEVKLLDHMVNASDEIASRPQLEGLVDLAEKFRPGVPDPKADPDESLMAEAKFKEHVYQSRLGQHHDIPRLSTRDLAQMCFKSARPGATLQRAAKATIFHLIEPQRHNQEAALELVADVNI